MAARALREKKQNSVGRFLYVPLPGLRCFRAALRVGVVVASCRLLSQRLQGGRNRRELS